MTRRRRANSGLSRPTTPHEGLRARYEAPEASQGAFQSVEEGGRAVLEATRRANARQVSHEQAEIQAAGVDEEALPDVGVPPQMHPAQAPGLVEMGVGSLEALAVVAEQALTAGPPDPPAGWHTQRHGRRACRASVAGRGPAPTRSCAAPGRPARPSSRCRGTPYLRPPRPRLHRQHRFDVLRRGDQRLDHRRRVARTGILHGDADDRARLQVDRVLGLVG